MNCKNSNICLIHGKKQQDASKILLDKTSKLARIIFMRRISGKLIRKDFMRIFNKCCINSECEKYRPATKHFEKIPGVNKNDILDFELFPSKVILKKNGEILNSI